MYYLKKFFLHSPGHYIGAAILALVVGAFRFYMLPEGINAGYVAYEVLSVSGWVTFLIGALLTVSYLGAFDLFGYVFSPGRSGGKYKTYADYSQKKAQSRSREQYYFVPYYVVGIILVLISNLVF